MIYRERGELERACECYLAALHIRPNFPQALNNLGVIYTSQGRTGEATALLQAATQASPAYAEAWNNLGVVQRDIGGVGDAIASYERAAGLAPDQPNAGAAAAAARGSALGVHTRMGLRALRWPAAAHV